ncbi:MAG TPA: hypothetical protein VKE41_24200 [Roseiflexaceae bacterium]|nr:hypothetical protein [Roseiflexaceae bacterium]
MTADPSTALRAGNGQRTTGSQRRFDRASWLVLALAVGYIAGALVNVLLAFQQPTDGWLYSSGLSTSMIVVHNQSDAPSPLRPGDVFLAIDGATVPALRALPPPPGWRVGGTAHYTIQRDGAAIDLAVPLVTRRATALLDYIWGGTDGSAWNFVQTILWYLIGFAVFLIRPRETAARLLLLIMVYWATYDAILGADSNVALAFYPAPLFYYRLATGSLWPVMFAMATHFVLAFPVRKWPLARWPRLTFALLYGLPVVGVALGLMLEDDPIVLATLFLTMATLIVALIVTTIHNLRTLRNPVARAQVGWLALGLCAPFLGAIIGQVALYLQIVNGTELDWIWPVLALCLPLCLGIAITRYRLFDIEIIIRRTLVYSILTLTLGLVYLGCIVVLQQLVVPVLGASELAIVASTLAIAALFNPLRKRIQTLIDKRFYRRKYDAAKVLAAFGATARDETDLERLTGEMLRVVDETMQPEFVGLWLRQPGHDRSNG